MVIRGEGTGARRVSDDPASLAGMAFRILNNQTPLALISILALAFLAYLYVTTLSAMSSDLRDHVRASGWYQRQSCISLAELAGSSPALCDQSPGSHDDRR